MKKWLHKANKRVSLGGAASLLIGVALAGQLLGFFRNRLVSTNFTVIDPGSSDAFFAAFQIPDFFFYTIAAGALGVAFIPFLSDHLERGDKEGVWRLTTSLLNLLAIIMLGVAVVIFVFAEPLIHYIVAPKLTGEHFSDAVIIMRLIALNPLLFTLSGILTSVQQTFGRFFFFAIAPLFYNLCIILSVYIFKHNIGIVGLGVGALAGALLQLLVASLGLFGLGFKWRPIIAWRSRDFKHIIRQLPARSIDQGIDSINSIVETNRAVHLGAGAVSYYNYALTLHNVPIMLLGTSIATAAFPRLTARLAQHRPDLFRTDFLKILRAMIWMTMPVLVISFFCRAYLARLLFGQAAPPVAIIFGYLTVAIFFRIMYSIISRFFYAQKDTKTPLLVSIFAIGLNIVLAFKLANPNAYGIAGLAMAQSLVALAEVIILVIVMLLRDRRLLNLAFWGGAARILSVTGFSVLATFVMISLLPLHLSDTGIVTLGSKLGLISLVTFLVHVGISSLFGLEEAANVVGKVRQFVVRPVKLS
jgi:putative peptidoglycan lipid II flippase